VGLSVYPLPLFPMPLWLPRSPPLALAAVTRRGHAVHPRVITYLHARHSMLITPHALHAWTISRLQSTSITTGPSSPPTPKAPKNTKSSEPVISRAWKKIKHEAQHYWHGSKLLAKEVRISTRLQRKILQGETLTRRERRQVRRNSVLSVFEFE
jgi:LETM1 and EF-hand domain-containing protein 1